MSKKKTLRERFEAFDTANPHVYDAIKTFAMAEITSTGRKRMGIAEIAETVRYRMAAEFGRAKGEQYKVNNSYRAFYARKLIEDRPDLFQGVIVTRKQKSDDAKLD